MTKPEQTQFPGTESSDEEKAEKIRLQTEATLREWWGNSTKAEIDAVVPKAIEYGAVDLQIMGDAMLVLMPQLQGKVDGKELAIAFYLLGKLARLFGAYVDGRKPSDDCWYDSGVYAKMAQKIRETGVWP